MEVLRRLIDAGKLHLMASGKNQVAYLTRGGDADPITAEVIGPAFPSEQFVAMCILAVEAHGEWVDIPDESEARQRGWKSVYEK